MAVELVPAQALLRARKALPTWMQLLHRPGLLVWCAFVLFAPFYVFKSGLPQPADWLVLLAAPLAVLDWDHRLAKSTRLAMRALWWFTVWVAIVNYGWAIALWRWSTPTDFIIHPLYYVFNAMLFCAALLLARRDRRLFLQVTVMAAAAAVAFQVVVSFVHRGELYRSQLFFENPNQLGDYALLCACLFALAQKPLGASRLWPGIAITCCAYLAVLSASRAALVCIFVLLFLLVFSNPRTIIIGSLAAVVLTSLGGPLARAIDMAEERAVIERDPHTTFARERGYDRIWEFPENLLVGAGEGAYDRFAEPGTTPRELHSSFGTLVFCYGIVGLALFGAFLWNVMRGGTLRNKLMLVPALLYMVAHQGLRFTMLWLVLAVFVIAKQLSTTAPDSPRAAVT